jgi:predicted metal-dependent peptidase
MNIYSVFDKAKELGVSTFKFGNSLIEETIFNFLLQKVELIVDTQHNITAYVTIRGNNMVLVINPEYLYEMLEDILETEPAETQLLAFYRGILKHELLHCALNHLIRDPKRSNEKLANIVMDALINREIQEFKYLNIPRVTPEELILVGTNEGLLFPSEKGEKLTWEQYYDFLAQLLEENEEEENEEGNEEKEDKKGNKGNEGEDVESGEDSGDSTGKLKNVADFQGQTQKHSGTITEGDLKQIPENEVNPMMDETLRQISEAIEEAIKTRGSGFLKSLYKIKVQRNKPVVNWDKTLRRFVQHGNGILSKDYSFKRRDRRTDLPPGAKYILKGSKIYILIDSSGSVSDRNLQKFGSEIYRLVKNYQMEYKIWTYTTEISEPVDIRQLKRGNLEITQRGGTDLRNALKELKETNKEMPDMWVVLTDGYDDVPSPKEFGKKRVMYIFTSEHSSASKTEAANYKYEVTVIRK